MLHITTTPPKRVWKTRQKGKNMQEKYLRPSACSSKTHHVFLWVDLGLRQKGGGKRKDKIQKDFTALKQKEQKIPKQQNKKNDHVSQLKEKSKTAAKAKEQNRQQTHRKRKRKREKLMVVWLSNISTSSCNVFVSFLPQFCLPHSLICYIPGFQWQMSSHLSLCPKRESDETCGNTVAKLRLVQWPSGVLRLNVLWDCNSPSQDKTADLSFSVLQTNKQTNQPAV